ncbi:hypothetical protein [Neobacillus vireti]|uniref:Uncharacterized protein n=1 Tax=Neobacillus vireti LMG 21834 TaxID=1131730 RepID=A0AB94IMT0_9BACI|nr:hypothetical protein [Neobacillus vireti]ETI68268.1 hypothetical protein BAVI_13439 [Neobacillus vireti LMG 21834]KLT17718.1 membrane protein [Neobacillus vireti]
MSLILLIGVLGVLFTIFFKGPIIDRFGKNNRLVSMLENTKWFQNHWIAGLFLLSMNAVLFVLTGSLLYLLMYLFIPFVHLLVMVFAVIGSIFLWIVINKAWQGTERNRLKVGAVGSSFYIFLTIFFSYWFATLKPSYPGEDTFMGAIGLIFAIIVTTVAFISCFVITGFSKKSAAQ